MFWKKGTKKRCSFQETDSKSCESNKIPKTQHACIVEAHESTRKRLESSVPKDHEDHVAGKGYNSMTHYNLVHKFILMSQAKKIPDAKAAVDKEWKKLETIPAWQLDKVKSKKEVILEAQKDKMIVHFATLMVSCHLKNARLESKHPKIQRTSRAPRRQQKMTLRRIRGIHRTKIVSLAMTQTPTQSHQGHPCAHFERKRTVQRCADRTTGAGSIRELRGATDGYHRSWTTGST